ncbi:MAG: cytochrome c oxidase subunit II [Verrucomicrobiales bacterium]
MSLNKTFGLPDNASAHGYQIDAMLEFCHWFMLILLVGWSAFFLFTLWRFHHSRQPRASYSGVKNKMSTHLELGVVMIEVLLLFGFAFPLWNQRINDYPDPEQSLQIRMVAEQFGWSAHYPGPDGMFGRGNPDLVTATNPLGLDHDDPAAADDIVIRNTMRIPVNQPVIISLSSKDVIHNFAIHQMRVAHDTIPGQEIPLWFTPIVEGEFEIICGQLCGWGHATMQAIAEVMPASDFQNWLDAQPGFNPAPAAEPTVADPALTHHHHEEKPPKDDQGS